MITSRKIKIWTLATHALIVVGFGHGIILLFLIEILWFPFATKGNFNFMLNAPFESRLPIVGLTSLVGQIAFLISITANDKKMKLGCQLIGLCMLWLSIIYFTWTLDKDSNVHFVTITALPFGICTVATFLGQPIKKNVKKIYQWASDNY